MQRRPSARLLVLNRDNRVLLFRFVYKRGALAGRDYWATPGGGVDEGETFAAAAMRELKEETGIEVESVGEPVVAREFVMQLITGEDAVAEEQYFVVRVIEPKLSSELWTPLEKEVMAEYRWWSKADLGSTQDVFFPENLVEILESLG